jgi:hypothetical protein
MCLYQAYRILPILYGSETGLFALRKDLECLKIGYLGEYLDLREVKLENMA